MFNIGFAELILVLLVAFLVVGPKDLPKVARWLGRCVRKARQLIRAVKQEIGWEELPEETKAIKQDLDQTIKDSDITADIRSASNDFKKSVDDARKSTGLKKP